MADLSTSEKRNLEKLLGMYTGYVLDFSNRTFGEFVSEHTDRDIFNDRYEYSSNSKANHLRRFGEVESNFVVAKLLEALIAHGYEIDVFKNDGALPEQCGQIVARLKQITPVADLEALSATVDDLDFEAVAKQIREAIETDRPEAGLDRLHNYIIKFVRTLCSEHGLAVARDKPLHSMFGEYVKRLRDEGRLESEMTARILKSSISVLEAFNDVRNNQSLAHDNTILNYDESLLIFNSVASLVRLIRKLEERAKRTRLAESAPATPDFDPWDPEIPF